MGAITDTWCAFKDVCKENWDLMFGDYSEGGLVNGTLPKDYAYKLNTLYKERDHDMILSAYTSLELLEELLERQCRESKLKK